MCVCECVCVCVCVCECVCVVYLDTKSLIKHVRLKIGALFAFQDL